MVIDMVLAEAVVPRTAGAVPELKLGKLRVRAAADRAFMGIQLAALFPADPPGFPPEIHRVCAGSLRPAAKQIPAAENQEIQHGHDGQEIRGERVCKHAQQEICRVNIGHVFYLYRDQEKQQHLQIGKQRRKGEEHGQVDILRVQPKTPAGNKIHQKAVHDGQQHAGEKVYIELRRSPILLQSASDPVIKIKHNEGQNPCAGRIEHKGNQPPYLPPENHCRVKAEISHKHGVHSAQYPEGHIGDAYIQHQIFNAKMGVLIAKTLYIIHRVFH